LLAVGSLGCGGASGGADAGDAGDAALADATPEAAGAFVEGPSCAGLPASCGPDRGASCCAASVVPGGTFLRDNGVVGVYTATVSDFRLDTYEISVGRFRQFFAAYPGSRPAPGSGANPNNPDDTGWDPAWDTSLPADQAALDADVQTCGATLGTWTAGSDSLPMNCITWFEAYAFCIWDGGRLPTEAEWNYAAAGGDQQRHYPWSNPFDSEDIDDSLAVYEPSPTAAVVGSRSPQGDARWGQADMAGNVWEWAQDWYRGGGYPDHCINCADLTDYSIRVIRGGDFYTGPINLLTSERLYHAPGQPDFGVGARCARRP
jgi:formylglycine-generating enzyme required for sulfatase activity